MDRTLVKNMSQRKRLLNNLFETIKQMNENYSKFENKYQNTFETIKKLPQERRKVENYRRLQHFFKKMDIHENMFKLKLNEMERLTANIKLINNFVPFTGTSSKIPRLANVSNYKNRGMAPAKTPFYAFKGSSKYLDNAPKIDKYQLRGLPVFRRTGRTRRIPNRYVS